MGGLIIVIKKSPATETFAMPGFLSFKAGNKFVRGFIIFLLHGGPVLKEYSLLLFFPG